MPRSDYEERKKARIDRLHEKARKTKDEACKLGEVSRRMLDAIPFGQPILIGHHSEKRDRNFRNNAFNKMSKAVELDKKAIHLESRAISVESNDSISSDDPEAIVKLKEKIKKLQDKQEFMKQVNKIIKSKPKNKKTEEKIKRLQEIGMSATLADESFKPDCCGLIGFPGYALSNNNANIRSTQKRLESLEKEFARAEENEENKKTIYDGFTVIENYEENRIQIDFNNRETYFKLCKDKGINLRKHGFKFSKYSGCWQRLLNNNGRWATKEVTKILTNNQ